MSEQASRSAETRSLGLYAQTLENSVKLDFRLPQSSAYRGALEVRTKAELPQDWGMTQHRLRLVLLDLVTRSGEEEDGKFLGEAVAAYRSALEVRTKADLPQG